MLLEKRMEKAHLTDLEKNIIQCIMENKHNLSTLSTRKIAEAVFASPSAVVRVAHKLGFKGYNDLKEQYEKEIQYLQSHFDTIDPNIPFQKKDTIMTIANIMKEIMIETANDTLTLLQHDTLRQAVTILQKANHIYIFAYSSYIPIAQVFQMKMSRIKKRVTVQQMIGEENYQADLLEPTDCAIVISYAGETESLLRVTKNMYEAKVPIIGITSIVDNSLRKYVRCVLDMSTREKIFSKIANYTSEYSVGLLLNILYSCCFNMDYEKNLDYKVNRTKTMEKHHIISDIFLYD